MGEVAVLECERGARAGGETRVVVSGLDTRLAKSSDLEGFFREEHM
jgi:hypothetical protein